MIPINDMKRCFERNASEYEAKAIEVLRSGWYILGNEVESFEKEFASFNGSRYCIGVDNGLNAIVLGVKALGIGAGDEVIVAANTYIATVLGISLNGATPVFVDPTKYHNLDPDRIQSAITKKTKAVLVTHFYGQACEMTKIKKICDKNNLYLLEDCAQAHGAEHNGKKVGTIGHMGFFSFYPTKNLGGYGDGGAILTDDSEMAAKLRALRNYGSVRRYVNDYEGHNSRLDELQAGLLRIKLKYLNELTTERRIIAQRYLSEMKNRKVELPETAPDCTHVYHLFVVQVEERDRFREHMKKCGVTTDIHYPTPPYLAKPYRYLGYTNERMAITAKIYERIVTLPLFNGMTEAEVNTVIGAVNSYE